MPKTTKIFCAFIIIFIFLYIVLLQYVNGRTVFVPSLIIICVLLLFTKNASMLIFLNVAFLSVDVIFPNDIFMGFLNNKDVLNIFVLFVFLFHKIKKTETSDLLKNNKYVILLIIIFLLYNIYVLFKNKHFNIYSASESNPYTISFRLLIAALALIYIIKNIDKYSEYVKLGIFAGIIILSVFVIFKDFLMSIGFEYKSIEEKIGEMRFSRISGYFDKGDNNSLASFFVIAFGFLIFLFKEKKVSRLTFYFFVVLTVINIFILLSRTAMISLGIISFIYFFKSNFKNKFVYFTLALIILFIIQDQVIVGVKRLKESDEQLETQTSGNRIGKWILYWEYMQRNPDVFLRGTDKEFLYNSHNSFIQIVFHGGTIPFFLVILCLTKICISSYKLNKTIIFILIPFLSIIMYVGELGVYNYFYLYIVLFELYLKRGNDNFNNKIYDNNEIKTIYNTSSYFKKLQ